MCSDRSGVPPRPIYGEVVRPSTRQPHLTAFTFRLHLSSCWRSLLAPTRR